MGRKRRRRKRRRKKRSPSSPPTLCPPLRERERKLPTKISTPKVHPEIKVQLSCSDCTLRPPNPPIICPIVPSSITRWIKGKVQRRHTIIDLISKVIIMLDH